MRHASGYRRERKASPCPWSSFSSAEIPKGLAYLRNPRIASSLVVIDDPANAQRRARFFVRAGSGRRSAGSETAPRGRQKARKCAKAHALAVYDFTSMFSGQLFEPVSVGQPVNAKHHLVNVSNGQTRKAIVSFFRLKLVNNELLGIRSFRSTDNS